MLIPFSQFCLFFFLSYLRKLGQIWSIKLEIFWSQQLCVCLSNTWMLQPHSRSQNAWMLQPYSRPRKVCMLPPHPRPWKTWMLQPHPRPWKAWKLQLHSRPRKTLLFLKWAKPTCLRTLVMVSSTRLCPQTPSLPLLSTQSPPTVIFPWRPFPTGWFSPHCNVLDPFHFVHSVFSASMAVPKSVCNSPLKTKQKTSNNLST